MKNIYLFLVFSFIFCSIIFLTHLFEVGTAIYGDGSYYYAIARSLAIDNNLNFSNEYSYLNIFQPLLQTGYLPNKYPPGAPFIWVPIIFLTHQIITFLRFIGVTVSNNGFAFPYQITVGLSTILLTIISLYFLYKTLRLYFSERISLLTILTILFTTNLIFYSAFDVINSHAISFAVSAMFFYILLSFPNTNKKILKKWLILGFLGGLMTLVRTQDILLTLPALLILLTQKQPFPKKINNLILFLLGFLVAFSPQFYIWKIIYGTFWKSPYLLGGEGFSFLNPQILGVLFNKDTGLILWTPSVFLGIVSLLKFNKNQKKLRNIFLLTVFLQLYFISSWSSWNQGASFGTRMMISSLPIIAFGFAELIELLISRISLKGTYLISIYFLFINLSLIFIYLYTH